MAEGAGPGVDAAPPPRLVVVGPGRAGGAMALALAAAGWSVHAPVRRGGDPLVAATDADVVIIATPDATVGEVAATLAGRVDAVLVHLSGSLGLDALAGHERVAAVHPLVSLPSAEVGAQRLRGAWFAVAGDPVAQRIVTALHGRSVTVADEDRARYHAAACIASNHLVALLAQVERVAATAGVPLEPYLDLVRGTIDNVAALGPAAALTGPAARGDDATIAAHRAALAPEELAAYDVLVDEARKLAARTLAPGDHTHSAGGDG
jgi:predicted short-subunit dehydrogenase-like oxidoreductase (DUF2520 family)